MTASSFRTNPTTGHEEIFQVNYLSTVLLAMLLLPVLRTKHGDEKPPVMTLINSGLAIMAKFKQRDASPLIASFDDPKNFDMDRYNTTKLLAHMWLWKLADVVHADDVVVNLADPGYVKGTDLLRDMPSFVSKAVLASAAPSSACRLMFSS